MEPKAYSQRLRCAAQCGGQHWLSCGAVLGLAQAHGRSGRRVWFRVECHEGMMGCEDVNDMKGYAHAA